MSCGLLSGYLDLWMLDRLPPGADWCTNCRSRVHLDGRDRAAARPSATSRPSSARTDDGVSGRAKT